MWGIVLGFIATRHAGQPTGIHHDPRLIQAIASWCDCVAGNRPLLRGLRDISESIGGVAAAMSRVSRASGAPGRAIVFDFEGASRVPVLERSYAQIVLGEFTTKTRAETIWFSSMIQSEGDPSLSDFQRRRKLKELVVIPLSVEHKFIDFLEIHFSERLDPGQVGILNMILATLCSTWSRRAAGMFSDALLTRASQVDATVGQHLLSQSNPARLSRAEYRMCLMLSRGLSTKALRSELEISNSTLRTHLRNIYAKTGTSSLAELTFRLVAPSEVAHQTERRVS